MVLSMTRDSRLKIGLIAGVIVIDAALIAAQGLVLPPGHLIRPLGFAALLAVVAWYYQRRRVETFGMCLVGLLQLITFTPAYTVLMYAIAATARPLVDPQLVRLDALCGVHLPDIVEFMARHPQLRAALAMVYNTLLYQMPLLVIVLGFRGDRRPLEQFVLRFMIAALVTSLFFWLCPAEGPFIAYGYEPSPDQQRYLDHFHALRSGERRLVTWVEAEGLITFPSFHTTWALLLAAALRQRRLLFAVSSVLNGLVVLSTLTTGWHYFGDVLGGVLVFGFAVALAAALQSWLYPQPGARAAARGAPEAAPEALAAR